MGSRIKRIRNKADFSSERASEFLSQLHIAHIEAVLQAELKPTRTVEEYADSGLRGLELKQNDLPAFPPLGFGLQRLFAMPTFEPLEAPSACWSPTFVPAGSRIEQRETMEDRDKEEAMGFGLRKVDPYP